MPNPAQAAQPDYIALAIVLALLAFVAVLALRKLIRSKKAGQISPSVPQADPRPETAPAATAPGSAGRLKLHDVPPKTAAMVMAIVADELGKPLNELRFISIREVENK